MFSFFIFKKGETPHSVSLFAYHRMVDEVKPGDRVEITGIYRVSSIRVSTVQKTVKSVFKSYIDVLHFQKIEIDAKLSTLEQNVPQNVDKELVDSEDEAEKYIQKKKMLFHFIFFFQIKGSSISNTIYSRNYGENQSQRIRIKSMGS